MLQLMLAAALAAGAADEPGGLFERAGFYLVRVTPTAVPNHPSLLGGTRLRVYKVLIGPPWLKGVESSYYFDLPFDQWTDRVSYSGASPDFAYPTPVGVARYWWVSHPTKASWVTANFVDLDRYVPLGASMLLLKADLKPGGRGAAQQADLVDELVRLSKERTWAGQLARLQEMKASKNPHVVDVAEQTLKTLTAGPKTRN